jgi:TetR/AcrR family transcriptional regulator, regulator of cefoperazone and chloramphenicol sensitivity
MSPRKPRNQQPAVDEPAGSPNARQRLIEAGVEIFSRYGYEGATTRRLASAAQVNLAAIMYYFCGKEELYLAVARHIAEIIKTGQEPTLTAVRQALAAPHPDPEALAELLIAHIASKADFLMRPETQPMGLFILREQVFPTQALSIFHEEFILPVVDMCCGVVGVILGIDPQGPEAAIRGQALFGEMVTFFTSKATLLRRLGTSEFTEEQVAMVVEVVTQHLRAILASLSRANPALAAPGRA